MQFGWCYLSETFATRGSSAIRSQYIRHHISPGKKLFQQPSACRSKDVNSRVILHYWNRDKCQKDELWWMSAWRSHAMIWISWWVHDDNIDCQLDAGSFHNDKDDDYELWMQDWKSTRMIIWRIWRDLEIGYIWLDDGYQQWHQRAKDLQNDGIFLLPFKLLLADMDLIPHHCLLLANIRHRFIPVSHYPHHHIICNAAYLYSDGISADGLLYDIQQEIL